MKTQKNSQCFHWRLKLARFLLHRYPLHRGRGRLQNLLLKRFDQWPDKGSFTFRYGSFVDVSLLPWPYGYRFLFLHGFMEDGHTRLLSVLLRSGDSFVDGGANFGYYSLLAAHLVGPQGRIFAFEPIPQTASRLRHNIEASGKDCVRVVEAALTERCGPIRMWVYEDDPMMGWSSAAPQDELGGRVSPTDCRSCSLDDYFEGREDSLAIIKLDIEGGELSALKGAERILTSNRPPAVWFEYNQRTSRFAGYDADETLAFLGDRGYKAYLTQIVRGSLRLSRFSVNRSVAHWSPMVLCLKKGFMYQRAHHLLD